MVHQKVNNTSYYHSDDLNGFTPIHFCFYIVDHKCIPGVFYSCFAPGIDTRTLLDRFLGCFKKSWFLRFSVVGFDNFETGRIFYGSDIGRILAGTHSYTSWLFPNKMGVNRSAYFSNGIEICVLTSFSQNRHFLHLSDLLNYLSESLKWKVQNVEMLLAIFIFSISSIVKKLWHFEVQWGCFTHLFWHISRANQVEALLLWYSKSKLSDYSETARYKITP